MLPIPDNRHALCSELPRDCKVSGFVAFQLESPEGRVRLRYMAASGTPMPEATVEKDRDSRMLEIDIRFPRNWSILKRPAPDAIPRQRASEPSLCTRRTSRLYRTDRA